MNVELANSSTGSAGYKKRLPPSSLFCLALLAPGVLLVGGLFVFPIGRLAALSFEAPLWSLSMYGHLFTATDYATVLVRTLRVSALVTAVCIVLGYPIAYMMVKSSAIVRAIIGLAVLLPFWTSLLVRNYAWVYLLQRRGPVNEMLVAWGVVPAPLPLMFNEFAVVLGMANALLPFMVLPIFVSLQAQERALLEAANSLGATPSVGFLTVTLPLSVPGIVAGTLVIFATALGFYVTPALLGGGRVLMAATDIVRQIEELLNWPQAAAASMVLLAVVTVVIGLYLKAADRLSGMESDNA